MDTLPRRKSIEFLTWVHKSFYDAMPCEFRVIEHPDGTHEPIVSGRIRQDDDREVAVGRHQPPISSRVVAFMDHFDKQFQIAARSSSGGIIAIASAHHRLNYIHPFPDGNGRVNRLVSYAMALKLGSVVRDSGPFRVDWPAD